MSARARLKTATAPALPSVNELLRARLSNLNHVTERPGAAPAVAPWLAAQLGPLSQRIAALSEREGTLTLFAESSAWCARLRYALAELEGALRRAHPAIAAVSVRVRPRGRSG